MEVHLYFIGLIASIGVIHLATVAAHYLGTWRGNRSSNENNLHSETQQRDDWYVFFHCADLLGKEPNQPASERARIGKSVQTTQERRDGAKRPRARA